MKKMILIMSIGLMLIGCTKPQQCELNSTGTLKVVSTQFGSYYTYVNDVYYGVSEPATISRFENVPTGLNTVDFVNVNDYNDAYFATLNFSACQESVVDL